MEQDKNGRGWMSRWFRMYDELLDDPKVQRLSGDDFKGWVNLLALASRHGGKLPSPADIAFALRLPNDTVSTLLERLLNGGLIERRSGGADGMHYAPYKWAERQYKSDTSTERVKRFRKRSETVAETPPETDTETEKEEERTVVPNPAHRATDCFNEICNAAGWHPRTDAKRQEGLSVIDGWLALGCSLPLILESIKYGSRSGEPTSSLKRFDGLIRKKRREQLGHELPITSNDVRAIAHGLGSRMRAA
jgi:predicted transcriptional regulator